MPPTLNPYSYPGASLGMNPIYNTMPATPPGFAAVPYMLGDLLAPMVGGVTRPYVPVNMSTADAQIAKSVIRPQYNALASRVYGHIGAQFMNTVGAMPFIDSIAGMTGYDATKMREDLTNGGRSFFSGFAGQFVAPMADQLLNGAGISGGSFIAAMDNVYRSRMNLMGPGAYYNPLDSRNVQREFGASSAMVELLNGMLGRRDPKTGQMTLMPNMALTQGFSRETIADVVMKAAGAGLFTSNIDGGFAGKNVAYRGGFEEQIRKAAAGYDLSELTYDDFVNGKADRLVDNKTAEKLKKLTEGYADKIKGITEALGAMRDLTNSIDDLDGQLDDLTNGDWKRSLTGLYHARDTAAQLKAISQTYNIDPNAAIQSIRQNRAILQGAAGITPAMQAIGLNGGGMFGFAAQTAVLQSIEDRITESGARGDPMQEARIRYQGVNSLARSMNTSAGRASQLLAYALQTGAVTQEHADRLRSGLMSGDRGLMGESLNRLLVTVFGSEEMGRKMMNDTQFMQSVRMGLSDKFGAYANKMMIGGADSEMLNRELHTAAAQRLDYANVALRSAGVSSRQTAEGVDRIVRAVVDDFSTVDGNPDPTLQKYGEMFREQVEVFKKQGMSPESALNATIRAFKKSPAMARFADKIDLAVTRQKAENNENAFLGEGRLEGAKALAAVKDMAQLRVIDGKKAAEIRKMVKDGRGKEALAEVQGAMGGLSKNHRDMIGETMDAAAVKYKASSDAVMSNREAEMLVYAAQKQNYGSEAISESIRVANEAALQYMRDIKDPRRAEGAYDRFLDSFSKSKYGDIYGDAAQERYLKAVEGGDADYVRRMGKVAARMQQMAVSVMGKNGWDMTYTGFFNRGIYAGNSAAAAAKRKEMIDRVAGNLVDDMQNSAEDRSTVAQDLISFLTGEKDFKNVLKIYDKDSAFTSKISSYIAKNDEFNEKQAAYEGTRKGYRKYMNLLEQKGRKKTRMFIDSVLKDNPELSEDNIKMIEEALEEVKDDIGSEGVEAIVGSLRAKREAAVAQNAAQAEIENVSKKEGIAGGLKDIRAKQGLAKRREAAAAKSNANTFAFMEGLDIDEETLDAAKGKLREAQDAMYKLISDEDVAKKLGIDSSKKLTKQEYTQVAMDVVKERASSGDSAAQEVIKKYAAAAKEQATQITGKLIIQNGDEQATALLEANAGGGL